MIPEISNDRLYELADRIKPLARFERTSLGLKQVLEDEGNVYLIEPCDLRLAGFNVKPVVVRRATGLAKISSIKTFHTVSPTFCPSVAEVLAQIPDKYLDVVTHFDTLRAAEQPKTRRRGKKYFVATTVLYAVR